jgi:hypothetical protein
MRVCLPGGEQKIQPRNGAVEIFIDLRARHVSPFHLYAKPNSARCQKPAQNGAQIVAMFTQKHTKYQILSRWLGREDSNLRMAESKSAALPLGYAPKARSDCRQASGGRKITTRARRINVGTAPPSPPFVGTL